VGEEAASERIASSVSSGLPIPPTMLFAVRQDPADFPFHLDR